MAKTEYSIGMFEFFDKKFKQECVYSIEYNGDNNTISFYDHPSINKYNDQYNYHSRYIQIDSKLFKIKNFMPEIKKYFRENDLDYNEVKDGIVGEYIILYKKLFELNTLYYKSLLLNILHKV